MNTRAVVRLFCCLTALAPCARGAAQQIRGSILLPDSSRAVGVIVMASDAHGTVVSRALSTTRGDFALRLPAFGKYDLRFLRIGFKPTTLSAIAADSLPVHPLHVTLRGEAITLATVTVQGKSVCRMQLDSAQTVARLWEEARKAIIATQLSATQLAPHVRAGLYERQTDLTETEVLASHNSFSSGSTLRPFASLRPDSLAKVGYATWDAKGSVYRAPDADALLSNDFASLHCFQVTPPPGDRGDWVGIGFRPVRNRGDLVDIEGTLWLDRKSSELRLLEYRYTNLPSDYVPANAGGSVEFVRLSNGAWVINRWFIRMPRTAVGMIQDYSSTNATGLKGLQGRYRVVPILQGLQFNGGDLLSVDLDGVLLYTAGESARDYSAALLADDAKMLESCATDTSGGDLPAVLRGTVFDDTHQPISGAAVRLTWRARFRIQGKWNFTFREQERDLTTSDMGEWFTCGVPRERVITVRATAGERFAEDAKIRIPKERVSARIDVSMPPKPDKLSIAITSFNCVLATARGDDADFHDEDAAGSAVVRFRRSSDRDRPSDSAEGDRSRQCAGAVCLGIGGGRNGEHHR